MKLKEKIDNDVMDNPPLNIVAEASISNRVADMTMYVVRAGVLDRRYLVIIEYVPRDNKLNNMGIIITDVNYDRLYYSVGYQGYGKRYGYYGKYHSVEKT